jgi:hypothetical protein
VQLIRSVVLIDRWVDIGQKTFGNFFVESLWRTADNQRQHAERNTTHYPSITNGTNHQTLSSVAILCGLVRTTSSWRFNRSRIGSSSDSVPALRKIPSCCKPLQSYSIWRSLMRISGTISPLSSTRSRVAGSTPNTGVNDNFLHTMRAGVGSENTTSSLFLSIGSSTPCVARESKSESKRINKSVAWLSGIQQTNNAYIGSFNVHAVLTW